MESNTLLLHNFPRDPSHPDCIYFNKMSVNDDDELIKVMMLAMNLADK